MSKFVQDHAYEEKQNENDPRSRRGRTTFRIIAESKPTDQQQKGDVNPQLNSGNTKDWERPAH